MTRQEYNEKILYIISDDLEEVIDMDLLETLDYCIGEYPDQRFGQIICNYICPDYRESEPSEETKIIMNKIFPIDYDPFFEESKETYERITNNKNVSSSNV